MLRYYLYPLLSSSTYLARTFDRRKVRIVERVLAIQFGGITISDRREQERAGEICRSCNDDGKRIPRIVSETRTENDGSQDNHLSSKQSRCRKLERQIVRLERRADNSSAKGAKEHSLWNRKRTFWSFGKMKETPPLQSVLPFLGFSPLSPPLLPTRNYPVFSFQGLSNVDSSVERYLQAKKLGQVANSNRPLKSRSRSTLSGRLCEDL